jgi:hypothetical protein
MGNLEVTWTFFSGTVFGHLVFTALIIAGILLLTGVFQAACALADVSTPNFLYSLLLVLLTLALLVPLNAGIIYLYQRTALATLLDVWMSVVLLSVIGFVLCVAISAALYTPILRISLKKGLLTGLFEQLLGLLLFSLLYGALLVVLAVVQIKYKPALPSKTAASPTVTVAVLS